MITWQNLDYNITIRSPRDGGQTSSANDTFAQASRVLPRLLSKDRSPGECKAWSHRSEVYVKHWFKMLVFCKRCALCTRGGWRGHGGGHDQAPKGLFGRSLCFRGEKTHTRAHTSFLYPGSLYPEIVHRGSQRTEAALFHCVFLMLRALWWLVQKWYPIDG